MNIVEPDFGNLQDIPKALRNLADRIEAGDYGDAHNLAWVIDEGDGIVSVGMLGGCAHAGAEAHLLLACGMRRLENG